MEVENLIKQKLKEECRPDYMELINESHMHAGPAADSHFKLILVSEDFRELSAVRRHQTVYRVLKDELAGPVHALALHLYTPEEWGTVADVPGSPQCAGKNK